MCGIVGYLGRREAGPLIIEGLKRLEYRGYDSFGIALKGSKLEVIKHCGRISEKPLKKLCNSGTTGIGHTRWATHGKPSNANAHPHTSCDGKIAVVHNGIIDNYLELKNELENSGHIFLSETDTEIIAHLIGDVYKGDLLAAVQETVTKLTGSFAILALANDSDEIIAARQSSPLVLGKGDGEMFAASDVTPLLEYTNRVIFLEDGDIAKISKNEFKIKNSGEEVIRPVEQLDWMPGDVKKGGFEHYMLKEIYEQPQVFFETLRAPVPDEIVSSIKNSRGITIVACGSSYHTGLVFKYYAESCARIPVRMEIGSEFRHYPPPINGTLIAITQSGETADTLEAIRIAKSFNIPAYAITNVQGSTVTRLATGTFLMRAGPEISVAATKSFIAQLASLFAILDRISEEPLMDILMDAHVAISDGLLLDIRKAVQMCKQAKDLFYIGRGPFYPIALEGALKMKEITYIHAEGYAAGELKHGPFALLSKDTPVVAICFPGRAYRATISNLEEIRARNSPLIVIGEEGDTELEELSDVMIKIQHNPGPVQIITATVVLQMLAYYTAVDLGKDVDKPRNLAKSVTVE